MFHNLVIKNSKGKTIGDFPIKTPKVITEKVLNAITRDEKLNILLEWLEKKLGDPHPHTYKWKRKKELKEKITKIILDFDLRLGSN